MILTCPVWVGRGTSSHPSRTQGLIFNSCSHILSLVQIFPSCVSLELIFHNIDYETLYFILHLPLGEELQEVKLLKILYLGFSRIPSHSYPPKTTSQLRTPSNTLQKYQSWGYSQTKSHETIIRALLDGSCSSDSFPGY